MLSIKELTLISLCILGEEIMIDSIFKFSHFKNGVFILLIVYLLLYLSTYID